MDAFQTTFRTTMQRLLSGDPKFARRPFQVTSLFSEPSCTDAR